MTIAPGTIALASTWPAWERYGAKLPHPIIVIKAWPNGNLAVLPVTGMRSLCHAGVELKATSAPWAYPPLSKTCWVCVRDRDGLCTAIGESHGMNLRIGSAEITLTDHRRLTPPVLSRLETMMQHARMRSAIIPWTTAA